MAQFSAGNSGIQNDLGYGLGIEWVGYNGILKSAFRGEILKDTSAYLEYLNHDLSYSYNLTDFDLPLSIGVGFENESWCDTDKCDENKNYRFSSAWQLSSQIEVVAREQLGFRADRSLGVHLGHKQASFEIEYHHLSEKSVWVYRQLWAFENLGVGNFVLGSEFASNPFLWSIWGEAVLGCIYIKPVLVGSPYLESRVELEVGIFF